MIILRDIAAIKDFISQVRKKNKTVGFVPTMGYLHEGHLTLMKKAKETCDIVVVSIFVNPMQFGQGEDYEEYPRDLTNDGTMAASVGVDAVFAPTVAEMYPQSFSSFVEVSGVTEGLCGASRPGHFRGVTTIVHKLFNIVQPDKAFFGQKDAQQVAAIKRMVADLNMNVQILTVPIAREVDGLAMSSRNVYLSAEERKAALILFRSLQAIKQQLQAGERGAGYLRAFIQTTILTEPLADIDYISISDLETLKEVENIAGPILIALAVRFGKTRLIDNMIWEG